MDQDLKNHSNPRQAPLPHEASDYPRGLYNCFPTFEPVAGTIQEGYDSLARQIIESVPRGVRVLVIDGYNGVDWTAFQRNLDKLVARSGIRYQWLNVADCLKEPDKIRREIEPFVAGDDPLFGCHYPMGLDSLFNPAQVARLRTEAAIARGQKSGALTVIYGCGSSLVELWDQLWYVDIPKDIIQELARKKLICNLGEPDPSDFGDFYKRAYFVEWPALNRLKRRLLPHLDRFIDLQNCEAPTTMSGDEFRSVLREISESPFRVRPWFFPGPWGGKYMQGHMGLDQDQPNFAWSFELIVPENGIVLEKGGSQLEFSFDCLMFQENSRVLGTEAARQFKFEWPIRLDYLDTIDGGNLSTQCHPRPNYIRRHFGETFTQDETYYIVNAKPDARVYLGLKESVGAEQFKQALTESFEKGEEIDIDDFVHSEPSNPHDLFLIPNGTIHCSGMNNLVLEISATPYIFTFKMYDYLRRDLHGKFRPLNNDRAFENIRLERRSDWVRENLIARPKRLVEGVDWTEDCLYDRPESFYNIHRVEFDNRYFSDTENRGMAINLVQGDEVEIVSKNGRKARLAYLETMVIPAATASFTVINKGKSRCKLILVFVRPDIGTLSAVNDPND